MWTDIVLASFWGGVVALDTTAVLQIMFSRPLVACSIMGVLLGNFPIGFTLGIIFELLYIREIPAGAARFAEGNVGSTAATAVAVLTIRQAPSRESMVVFLALILGLLISSGGGKLVSMIRHINGKLAIPLFFKESVKTRHVVLCILAGIGLVFSLGFFCVLLTSTIFVNAIPRLVSVIPQKYDKVVQPVMGGLLAVGCVFLIQLFWSQQKRWWLLFLGLAIGLLVYLKVM